MFLIAVALLFILMTVLLQFYFRYNTLFLKAACTSVGVMLSLWAVLKKADVFSILVFCALLLCMAADVILELRFVIGMLVFLCGHLFLIAALLQFAQPQWVSLLLWLLLYSGTVLLFRKYIPQLGSRFLPFMVYPVILLGMLSLALPLPFMLHNTGSWLFAAGAFLFSCSDLLLAHNIITENHQRWRSHLVMYWYEPAIFLLALSVFYR